MDRTASYLAFIFAAGVLATAACAYNPPPGYLKTGQSFWGSAIAVAPDGKVAVGEDNYLGNASIKVYSSLSTIGGTPLSTITQGSMQFISGIEFLDNSNLVFGDSGSLDTVLKATLGSPAITPVLMAPGGSVPNIADLTISNGVIYATAANGTNAQGAGLNQLIRINADNTADTVIDFFGSGYIGGVTTDAQGNFLVTDSGTTAGLVRRFKPDFSPLDVINLSAGNGTGAVDLVFDSEGDLVVSTGRTLTQVRFPGGVPAVSEFGTFDQLGQFGPYPTFLAYTGSGFEPDSGNGLLIVSGFTDEPGAFIVQTPEPAGALALLGTMALLMRRCRVRVSTPLTGAGPHPKHRWE